VWLQVLRKGGRRIEGQWRPPNPKSAALARVARALDVPVEEMFARAGRDATPSTRAETQETAPHEDVGPGAVERIRELEERVARTEQEMAELRQLLERQRAERANVR
jgi:antitoxin component HigA of HigAB toxin-antitoxin module